MTRDDHTHNALDKFVAHTAVKRWGLPQEVGQGAVFLAVSRQGLAIDKTSP